MEGRKKQQKEVKDQQVKKRHPKNVIKRDEITVALEMRKVKDQQKIFKTEDSSGTAMIEMKNRESKIENSNRKTLLL